MKRIKFLFATTLTLVVLNGFVYGQDTTLTVTSDGNVGIGTTNPAFLLDVFGTNYKVRYNSGGNVDVLINRASNSNFGNLQYASDNTLLWAIGLRGVSAADGLFFHDEDAGISRMMIDGTSGNVGIGTTTPGSKLEVNGTVAASAFASLSPLIFQAPAGTERMRIDETTGNVGIGTVGNIESLLTVGANQGPEVLLVRENSVINPNNLLGAVMFDGQVGQSTVDASVMIEAYSSEAHNSFNKGGYLTISTKQDGRNNNETALERMRITSGGNVGIGTSSPSFPLEMGSGAHVTTGGVWTDASSRQYKENISTLTLEEAIAALEKLNPVRFNYKVEKDEEYVGFIAEDVPDLVATKDRQSLSPMDIVAVLTKVVQQQQKKIAELEARFNDSQ